MSTTILTIFLACMIFRYEQESAGVLGLSRKSLFREVYRTLSASDNTSYCTGPVAGGALAEKARGGVPGGGLNAAASSASREWGSRIQTGLPMAPARWAMQVSVVTTRSSVARAPLFRPGLYRRAPRPRQRYRRANQPIASAALPFCRETQVMPRRRNSGSSVLQMHGALAVCLVVGIACPGKTDAQVRGCF